MLEEYNKKRNFVRTSEPRGKTRQSKGNKTRFVVQKHDATRLHYDFRLEEKKEGVLKSWAVPKGISLDPKVRRLAILTEDHPLDYLLFEGIIPEGSYGAGTVIVWDTGTFTSEQEISDQFEKGKITFSLNGQKLRGKFTLVRIRSRGGEENQWLLMKSSDRLESEEDLTISRPESVLTGKTIENLKDNENIKDRRTKSSSVAQTTKSKSARDLEGSFKIQTSEAQRTFANNFAKLTNKKQREDFVTKIKPMLSTLVDKPFDNKDWVFEANGMEYVQYCFCTGKKEY
jgi:bifunctional non-homologous end joining protein LigD